MAHSDRTFLNERITVAAQPLSLTGFRVVIDLYHKRIDCSNDPFVCFVSKSYKSGL